MIDLYFSATPNGLKARLFLEEAGLDYTIRSVKLSAGEQFRPEFLAISPNNKIPAIVDHDPVGGGEPLALFESGAIMPGSPNERSTQRIASAGTTSPWSTYGFCRGFRSIAVPKA